MTTQSVEVLVVGGGATGLGVAFDAALRGFQVTVVEQGDLGQGTSGRYHGLLHSGARYVLTDPVSAAECRKENAILRRMAPHTIEATGGLFLAIDLDPPDFPDRWLRACGECGVPAGEISPGQARAREPLLTPRVSRAFEVEDAALDSFELLHALRQAILDAGGSVLLRHRLTGLVPHQGGMLARVVPVLASGTEPFQIEARYVVNAAGPFCGVVAGMAGVNLPLSLGKGTMVAMASRLTHTVLNRCKPPHDGDIIVPVVTVCILGTTDVPVRSPLDLQIEPWEIDLLLGEGQALVPGIRRHRPLRAWAGIRALYRPGPSEAPTRDLPRAHAVLNHETRDGIPGFVSVLGGKLTTYRKMAEDAVDVVAAMARSNRPCTTASTPLPGPTRRFYSLRLRAKAYTAPPGRDDDSDIVCECEAVAAGPVRRTLLHPETAELDDVRRDLRLGMGPCQGAFCTYRASALALGLLNDPADDGGLAAFVAQRWRGLLPLAWGRGLRQLEFLRRVHTELLGAESAPEGPA
ncbi:MAG TPA: FAD-dependent oxidoreductase [Anaerolineales bacterium]|nr:FAD-dependent oxidoreductase [Anaerolineales bacterium]